MKKLIILVLTALMMVGCVEQNYKVTKKPRNNQSGFSVIEFDSCEYIQKDVLYQGFLAHKGNCKYCAERRKAEQEKIVITLSKNK